MARSKDSVADEARARAEDALEAAQDALEQARGAVEDGIDDAHRYMRRQWRERPLTVAGAALGVGLVLGVLIGSRR